MVKRIIGLVGRIILGFLVGFAFFIFLDIIFELSAPALNISVFVASIASAEFVCTRGWFKAGKLSRPETAEKKEIEGPKGPGALVGRIILGFLVGFAFFIFLLIIFGFSAPALSILLFVASIASAEFVCTRGWFKARNALWKKIEQEVKQKMRAEQEMEQHKKAYESYVRDRIANERYEKFSRSAKEELEWRRAFFNCPKCHGRGLTISGNPWAQVPCVEQCPYCHGSGHIE